MQVDITQLQGFNVLNNSLVVDQLTTLPTYQLVLDMRVQAQDGLNVIRVPRVIIDYTRGNFQEHREITLTLSSGYYVSSWTSDITSLEINIQSAYIIGLASDSIPLINDYDIIRCYAVNNNIMSQLASVRFFNTDDMGSFIDLGKFILKYIRYPFNIDTADSQGNIQLGFYDTNILSDLPLMQFCDINLGSVLVYGLYHNNADIDNASILLHLPYYGIYNLDSIYINTTIDINYHVDILSNLCVIQIYSNNVLVDCLDCAIGYNIPYILDDMINIKRLDLHDTSIKKITPKIIVLQSPKIDNFYLDVKQYDKLDNISGFTRCMLYDNNICDTTVENDLLSTLCNQGIYL